ncbi:MAG: NADH-quinone oxidoreductase subunit NuoE [Aminivibrio sp.]|jgi:NADH-quinone oxidoreductase subunit E|nr:NADH-quinone oxidoreductase subunit NuoE [Aminivibrio sp.]
MVVETQQDARSLVREITAPWKGKHGGVIPVLQETQKQIGYLSREAMEAISEELSVPLAELYGVATFYAQFHLKPRGRHIIRVCRGTACHVRGSAKIMEKIMSMLGIAENGTTDDLRFTLEPVACLGCCGLAPVVMIDEDTHGRLTADQEKLQAFLDDYS